jgi:hypothetical protein
MAENNTRNTIWKEVGLLGGRMASVEQKILDVCKSVDTTNEHIIGFTAKIGDLATQMSNFRIQHEEQSKARAEKEEYKIAEEDRKAKALANRTTLIMAIIMVIVSVLLKFPEIAKWMSRF